MRFGRSVDMKTGDYNWVNGPEAEKLPEGANAFAFKYVVADANANADDCNPVEGSMNITVTGDAPCVITLGKPGSEVDDENGSTASGNFLTGASDSDNDFVVLKSVDLSSTLPSGLSQETLDSTDSKTGDAIHTITISDVSGVVGTLSVDMKTGDYNWVNGPEAEKLPEGANAFAFKYVVADANANADDCNPVEGSMNITVTGDDQWASRDQFLETLSGLCCAEDGRRHYPRVLIIYNDSHDCHLWGCG
ncbi:hypothetical protein Bealeia1_00610 [Candidatus Bealeia paramacronuclearis]|uniref:RapA2 cadherin-like domain-containing protein n=2 Tax=Candidatus Bealeia paramacronuclearis TaxID=1921001 RepID=A0ABZ2C1U8_9PROT